MQTVENNVPRRFREDLLLPIEKQLLDCVREIEKLPADVRLTDAVNIVLCAKDKVADFIESDEGKIWQSNNK